MATLKDIAQEAGLTVSTVSRILNNRGYISENARNRVKEAMEKLNYQPNEMARSLRMKNTNIVGLIVPHIDHPYFSRLISYIESYACQKDYQILICNVQGDSERVREYVDVCISKRVAGIILLSGNVTEESFAGLTCPMITVERTLESSTATVECDNYQGGVLAAECLLDKGCRNLLLVGGVAEISMPADRRTDGFRDTCEKRGAKFRVLSTNSANYVRMDYYKLLEKALKSDPDTDGIFCSSDVIAAQAIQICRKYGRKVPEEIKIIGFDDISIAKLTVPTLTSVHQPIEEMAETAVELLMAAIQGKCVAKNTVFPVRLVERESTM